jgi:nitrogen fixation protein FixH
MPTDFVARKPDTKRAEFRLTGKHVLVICVSFFAVVAGVNGFMMQRAISTMPGLDARNGYDPSQRFNREQEAARERLALGWTSRATIEPLGEGYRVLVTLTDATGQPLTGLDVDLKLAHPADTKRDLLTELIEAKPGRYSANVAAARAGAWDITIEARRAAGGDLVYKSQARTILKALQP